MFNKRQIMTWQVDQDCAKAMAEGAAMNLGHHYFIYLYSDYE